jgi:SecD/SecF fusion protein
VSERRRNLFVLLLVLGLLIASAVVLTQKPTKKGLDLQGGVELVYQAKPTKQTPVTEDALQRAIDVMRERVDQLGVAEPELQRTGSDQISIALPAVKNLAQARQQVGTVAQLAFYDWEKNVIGPDGKTAPDDPNVTGGQSAGSAGALTLYDAILRATKRPAKIEANNSHEAPVFYAVNPKTKKVFRSGTDPNALASEDTQAQALANVPRALRSIAKIYAVQPDTVIVRAEQPDTAKSKSDQWFVLKDDVALKGTEIKNPQQSFDQGAGGTGQPIVTFDFTSKGRKIWQNVTREIAQRGADNVGVAATSDPAAANQHFAIVLDDELVSTPFIDFRQNPDGIDGRTGSQISGGFTIKSAQALANVLKTGALPLKLELISNSEVP